MNAREKSAKQTSYDVAPAHDADAVQTAPAREAQAPKVSAAAVEEIKANANESVATRARELRERELRERELNASELRERELRGEEFDFDLTAPVASPGIEVEAAQLKSKPKYSWAWLLLALALLICVYTFGAVNGEKSRRPTPVGPFTAANAKPITVKVQVAGAVNKPGVYALPFNARVQDAIRQAGGFKSDADKNALNLADWAQDGAKIDVPSKAAPAPTPTPTVIIKEVPVPARAARKRWRNASKFERKHTANRRWNSVCENRIGRDLDQRFAGLSARQSGRFEQSDAGRIGSFARRRPQNGRANFGLSRRKRRLQKRGRIGRSQRHRRKTYGHAETVGQSAMIRCFSLTRLRVAQAPSPGGRRILKFFERRVRELTFSLRERVPEPREGG